MSAPLTLHPIGVVRNDVAAPRDTGWGGVVSRVELDAEYSGMLDGLDGFSHAVVVFWMQGERGEPLTGTARDIPAARHPRNDPSLPRVGLLAQRARHRPNPLGVTACALVSVADRVLTVRGLDAIDGTPVLDVKPHVPAFDAPPGASVPVWMHTIMRRYFTSDGEAAEERREAGVAIRPLVADDLPALHALWRCAGLPFRPDGRDAPDALAALFRETPDLVLAAVRADDPSSLVGAVLGTSDLRKGTINRLAVDPAWRRRGIARMLVDAIEAALFARGLFVVSAMVFSDNAPSLALFQRCGYVLSPTAYLRKSIEP